MNKRELICAISQELHSSVSQEKIAVILGTDIEVVKRALDGGKAVDGMVRKGLGTGKTVKRTAGTDLPADCLGTAEGNIHIVLRNFKSVRVRPFAKVAFRTLCNVLHKMRKVS